MAVFITSSADWILARQSCAVWRFRGSMPAASAPLARRAWMETAGRRIVNISLTRAYVKRNEVC